MAHEVLLDELREVQQAAADSWHQLDLMFSKARCLVSYQRSAII